MRTHHLTHLSDAVLLRDLDALVARERDATAAVLAHIAEVDARRLYLPEGFPSMRAYCVGKLRFSEDAAYKRIQAARAAREFPVIFTALAEGRLHLTGLGLLAPHLTTANAGELLAAAVDKTKAEIEELLARRFPRTEMLALVQTIPASPPLPNGQLAPAQVATDTPEPAGATAGQLAPAQVQGSVMPPQVKAWAAERYALQFTIGKATHDKLRYVQALLSHRLPSGDIAQVLDQALDALAHQLEKRKFAATEKPLPRPRRPSANPRHIPAHVKRAVRERDQGQCSFVSANGQRCGSRKRLEFDHIDPVARGGQATVEGVRLRCRGHNQFEAERVFGAVFMNARREKARRAAAEARTRPAAAASAPARAAEAESRARAAEVEAHSRAAVAAHAEEVIQCLRELRFGAGEARRAAEFCATLPDATLEERVRAALKFLCPVACFHRRLGTRLEART